ncbi:hypothetical protein [Flagellimonas sp. 2504JD1-5]
MDGYNNIIGKLNEFTRRYYIKQLIKGGLLFVSLGLLFLLTVMYLEYSLWLDQNWRLFLFWSFILVEVGLLYRFILTPVFYLFKVKKGLSNKEAARLIGKHFINIDDKLFNLLELAENKERSELLLASIEQKSQNLNSFAFVKAVDVKEGLSYAKYAVAPILIIVAIWLSGNIASFFGSYTRVVNYDLAYERPAPFIFRVLNDKLEVLDNESLTIDVEVIGEILPENVFLVVDDEQLLLKRTGDRFTYTFEAPVLESDFYFTANGWDSRMYSMKSLMTPTLVDFKMKFRYPSYLGKEPDVITGTGNGIVPEGTVVTWDIQGNGVDQISVALIDTTIVLKKLDNGFVGKLKAFNSFSYELSTSNVNIQNFERLGFQLEVIKDAYPVIEVEQILDSVNYNQSFFVGETLDDYKVSSIRVVCYPVDDRKAVQRITLESPNTNIHRFYYTFPSGFELAEGKGYKVFFEVIDNDGLRNGKLTRSRTFNANLYGDNELITKKLDEKNRILEKFDNSLKNYKEQEEELSRIYEEQKKENNFDFEKRTEIRDFLQKQRQQEQLMEKFSSKLKENFDKDDSSNQMEKMLKERLERQELEAKKNEKLLEELEKLSDKINKEDLKKRLEEIGKKQNASARNLEQILELTKRYYVTEKMSQLSKELEKLAERQDLLSKMKLDDYIDNKLQKDENNKFKELSNELDTLRKDNENLKKPLNMNVAPRDQESVKKDQQDALEEINKHQGNEESSESQQKEKSGNKISQKQKSAAQKIRDMSQAMQQSAMGGGGSSDTEDAEMLRQILDNLVTFSFKQENLFDTMENANTDVSQFSKTVRNQKELRRLFEHVDDSLFALSLRRAELSEFVNEQITEVYYNIDKSLESIADNQIFQGSSYQQYVINSTNALADFLANVLDNMQQSMQPGQGSGQGGGDFQLPDIIEGQRGIGEKMKGSGQGQKDKSGEEGERGEGKDGESEGKEEGQDGNKEGNGRENGEPNGQDGKDGNQGENGQDGSNEMGLNEIYEIYKEQQHLRHQLEKQLQDMIDASDRNLAKKLIQQMERFENDLLENGITQRTRNRANNIQHQLLKLDNAVLKQGMKKERKSTTNLNGFSNPIITKPEALKEHRNQIEILNRQALPLRQNYDKKVKVFFKND